MGDDYLDPIILKFVKWFIYLKRLSCYKGFSRVELITQLRPFKDLGYIGYITHGVRLIAQKENCPKIGVNV